VVNISKIMGNFVISFWDVSSRTVLSERHHRLWHIVAGLFPLQSSWNWKEDCSLEVAFFKVVQGGLHVGVTWGNWHNRPSQNVRC
jgi:hypothetical protein